MAKIDTSVLDSLYNKLYYATRQSIIETTEVVLVEAKKAFLERKKQGVTTSGDLLGSFTKEPIRNLGGLVFSGIVFVGGPGAPYAPYVDQTGWKTKEGHRDGYQFMLTGAEKGAEAVNDIVIKNFSVLRI